MNLVNKVYAPSGVGSEISAGMKPKMQMAPGPMSSPMTPSAPAAPSGLAGRAMQSRPFNAPVQNKLGTMEYTNLQPRGNPQPGGLAGRAMAAGAGMGSPGGQMSTGGFTAYADKNLGSAGFMKSGGDRKAGWVAQSGAYKGKTRDEAMADLRTKYAGMSPEEKAQYEAMSRNEDIGDAGSGMMPQGPVDPPMKLAGVDKVQGSLARRAMNIPKR